MRDPGLFQVTSQLEDSGPTTWIVDLAADTGHLVGGRTRTVAVHDELLRLPLPHGLTDPVALEEAVAWLAAIERVPPAGTDRADDIAPPAALAVGAFSFDPAAPAELVVPATAWCLDAGGRIWQVRISPKDSAGTARRQAPPATATPGAGRVQLRPEPSPAAYERMVAAALGDIAAGDLAKVVLARSVEVTAEGSLPTASAILSRLWAGDPSFLPYAVPVPGGRLVGASPELLISKRGADVRSHPFAGTVALGAAGVGSHDDEEHDAEAMAALIASVKDRVEHAMVVDEIAAALRARTVRLEVPAEPSVVRLRTDARLSTLVRGELRRDHDGSTFPGDSALGLLAAIHPTPAVAGVPVKTAVERIVELERLPRGYWAGAVGWVDAAGDGEWTLCIRAALLAADRRAARLHAGAGIVEGSVPEKERRETGVKLVPVLEALAPGLSGLL